MKTLSGTFTPPADLQPAIDALGEKGKQYLAKHCQDREITHKDIAKAADADG